MTDTLDTPPHHLELIPLSDEILARLRVIAQRVADLTPVVGMELEDYLGDPTRHRLHRLASALRYVGTVAEEPLKTTAISMAEELEALAQLPA